MLLRPLPGASRKLASLPRLTTALVGSMIFLILPGTARKHRPAPPAGQRSHVAQAAALGKLPLSFEANRGQTDPQVKFLARGEGYRLFLTSTGGAVLDLAETKKRQPGGQNLTAALSPARPDGGARTLLGLNLVGANNAVRATGSTKLPGKSNYLFGRTRKDWRTGIPNYGKVSYQHIYPGVDLTYRGNQQQLEYDFVVAPGADPSVITLDLTGTDALDIDADGNLLLRIAGRQFVQRKPAIYQQARGVRRPVAGSYALKGSRVSFAVESYDRSIPLMIEPVLVYATYLGGGSSDQGTSVAVDPAGVAYVSGITTSADFPAVAGATVTRGGSDIFVTKLNAAGTALEYSTYLGGSNDDESLGLSLDRSGNIYVTGSTNSTDFPVTANARQPTLAGGTDAFVVKLNPAGSALVYATYLGGSGDDEGFGIASDSASNAYVVGVTDSVNFPTAGAVQAAKNTGSDLFLTKLNSAGTALSYSTYLGGNGTDWGFGLTVDAGGHAYVAGITNSTNFPVTPNAPQTALNGSLDGFITKLSTTGSGSQLVYSTYLGGSGLDGCFGLTTDQAGNAYVTGITISPNFPVTPGALQATLGGNSDAFVAKLNPAGTSLTYATYLGGGGPDWGYGIALDPAGNAYVIGSTESANFPTAPGAFQVAAGGSSDAFISKLNPVGAALAYGSYLGGISHEDGFGIALDSASNAYVTGATYSTNFPALAGSLQSNLRGGMDAFIAKVSTSCAYALSIPAQSFNTAGGDGSVSVTTAGGCGWTASSNSDWITINAGNNNNGNASVSYTVAANTGTARVGALTIAGQSFVVTQAAASGCGVAAIHPTIRPFDSAGGNGQLTVVASGGCSWSAASNNSWLTLVGGASGTGTGRARYAVAANPSTQTRIGTLSVAGQVYRVTQTGIGAVSLIQFSAAATQAREDDASGVATINVTRTGDASGAATVMYATIDNPAAVPCNPAQTSVRGTAYARCDYATAIDTVTFSPGETSKSFNVSLANDVHAEGNEAFQVALTSPQGATLGPLANTTITIADDDAVAGTNNPIFGTPYFVRQQYLDFLSREPEPDGFNAWVGVLNRCPNVNNLDPHNPSAGCDRILVSSSFFGSQEFRLKGFFVFLFYKVSYNRLPEYEEIVPDMRRVTGQTGEEVFAKRLDFTDEWVARPAFAPYNGMSDPAYVDALLANVGANLSTPDPDSSVTRNSLVADLQAGRRTRAEVLRAIVETREVIGLEFNRAFVAIQYYGYLRRKPEPDGYQAWLNYLNANPTDFHTMINGFMNSVEYKLRFGPTS